MKIDRVSMTSEFGRHEPVYRRLLEESLFILERGLHTAGVKVHSIPTRVKSVDSLIAKAERKENIADAFSEITDIVGLRVVCLFLSDISRVGDVIRSHFEVVSEDNKLEDTDVSSFGYLSVHFVTKMKKAYSGPRYEGLAGQPLEIQVRTIAMDAWATISHYLDYKSEMDVPSEMRRDFYALSGLFYVADSHFEMFFKQRERGRVEIVAGLKTGKLGLDQEMNLDTLSAYLSSKFADRKHSTPGAISDLMSQLHLAGYRKLSELDDAIDRGYDAFLAYERDHPPISVPPQEGARFADVGVVRILLNIADEAFRATRKTPEKQYISYRKMVKTQPKGG